MKNIETILDLTNDAISVADEKGNTILVNDAYTKITGLPKEAILNKPVTVDIAEGESRTPAAFIRRDIKGIIKLVWTGRTPKRDP